MNATQTRNSIMPEGEDLGQETVRELIVQLALTADERRGVVTPEQFAALARREQDIVAALQHHRLVLKNGSNPNRENPGTAPGTEDGLVAQS
ncbi:hypothetical protein [Arthrobacter sp. HLT1-20]